MTRAVVIGATGQIGRAAVRALAGDGWEVTAVSRGGDRDPGRPDGVRVVRADREDDAALAAAVGDGCDVLVDTVAYGPAHARQLTGLAGRVGSAVVISSVSVYEDDEGRSFDTQDRPGGFPEYPVPLTEGQRTVRPGDSSYSTRKAALERELLAAGDTLPVTLLRAGAVHGPYCRTPRELWFVKRNLDGRRRRVLAYGGASRFHPAAVGNLAELVRLAAARPGTRVLNAVDPDAPTVPAARRGGRRHALVGAGAGGVRHDGGRTGAGLPAGEPLRRDAPGDGRLHRAATGRAGLAGGVSPDGPDVRRPLRLRGGGRLAAGLSVRTRGGRWARPPLVFTACSTASEWRAGRR
jgi:nucleoside-diphosphate-sugar epimerase